MEAPSAEAPERPVVPLENDVDRQNHGDQTVPDSLPREDGKVETEASEELSASGEDVRGVLEVIASTGKFWHDWDKLRAMLSFQLKQVLSEYPDAKMNGEEQHASLSETYAEVVSRLDQALLSFAEGPPFTLQRLCENLLVSSTLTVCTDPYPQTLERPDATKKWSEKTQLPFVSVENGVEPVVADGDEIMSGVEEGDIDDSMTIDMEALEDIITLSDANSLPSGNS